MWRLKLYRDVWCAVRRKDGKTERVSLSTKNRDEAERQLIDLQVERKPDLIGSVIPAYIEDKRAQGAKSVKAMAASWKALKTTFAHLRPDQITRPKCREYAALRRAAGISNGTIIKDLGVMKAGLGWAKMAADAQFDMPSAPPPRDRYLSREEVQRLWEASETAHIELFIRLAWATAGRASAILELTWDRVDFDRGQIRLATWEGRQKGRATVGMTQTLREALQEAFSARTSAYVVDWGGKPVKSIAKGFRRAAERAGIENVSPHILRHSSAVKMVTEGVDIYKVAQFLGHTDPRVTYRTYARFRPEHMADAVKALE